MLNYRLKSHKSILNTYEKVYSPYTAQLFDMVHRIHKYKVEIAGFWILVLINSILLFLSGFVYKDLILAIVGILAQVFTIAFIVIRANAITKTRENFEEFKKTMAEERFAETVYGLHRLLEFTKFPAEESLPKTFHREFSTIEAMVFDTNAYQLMFKGKWDFENHKPRQ